MKNAFLDRRRRKHNLDSSLDAVLDSEEGEATFGENVRDPSDGPEQALDRAELGRRVVDALSRIPKESATLIRMIDVDRLSYADAAEALNLPIGTVRSGLFTARNLLRRAFDGERRPRGRTGPRRELS